MNVDSLFTFFCTVRTATAACLQLTWVIGLIFLAIAEFAKIGYAQTIEDQSDLAYSDISHSSELDTKLWELSEEELRVIEDLTKKYHGVVSSQLSPVEWLGIFAENDDKRSHYAQILAKQQIAITDAILLFESQYVKAIQQLANKQTYNSPTQSRLLFIVAKFCADQSCKRNLRYALERVKQGDKLEILIQDRLTNQQIENWKLENKLPLTQLSTGSIRVQQAHGRYLSLREGIYRVR